MAASHLFAPDRLLGGRATKIRGSQARLEEKKLRTRTRGSARYVLQSLRIMTPLGTVAEISLIAVKNESIGPPFDFDCDLRF